jgi:hypothetical protein
MNKKLMAVVVALITTITSINMVQANQPAPATVAILDTALNAKLPIFKDKIIHEACVMEFKSCANGSDIMEGPGAAFMPLNQMSRNGFDHGTKMTSASVLTNPNIKVVFVRIIGATPSGAYQFPNEETFVRAFRWVYQNKDKFNIQAVALSQANHQILMPGANYCPITPSTSNIISDLDSAGVPVFAAAGNMKDLKRISWPACVPQSVAVSATSVTDGPASYTNYDIKLTDMFANGRMRLVNSDGYIFQEDGTSVSAQIAASVYVGLKSKYPTYTKQQVLDLMKSKSYPVKSKTILGYIIGGDILNG